MAVSKVLSIALSNGGVAPGVLFGLTMSTAGASTSLTVAAGFAADSTVSRLMRLASSITKTTSAWAVGTAAGGLDTGAIAATTWYHFYEIMNPATGVVDVVFSLNATTPTTLPTGYTLYRRIGSAKTNGSSQWTLFIQQGDTFLWDVPSTTSWVSNLTAALVTLVTPLGLKTQPIMTLFYNGTGETVYISSPDTSDQVPGNPLGLLRSTGNGQFAVPNGIWTNTSSQVRARGDTGGGTEQFNVQGWIDTRGRSL